MASLMRNRWAKVVAHPYLALYGAGLVGVWVFSLATGTTEASSRFVLHPIAQALQYLLVVYAASLAGHRLHTLGPDDRDQVRFAFGSREWTVEHDLPGRAFWTAVLVGVVAMEINIALLIAAELLITDVSIAIAAGEYLAWLGAGIAAGVLLGMLSAFVSLATAALGRVRHSD